MTLALSPDLILKARAVRVRLEEALREYGRVVYASSLGAEAMVLTDIICSHVPGIDLFTIDTGRLPEETHRLLERLEHRYGRRLRVVHPQAGALEALLAAQGINGFYGSAAARLECCRVRKLEPFRRALAGYAAWVTGVRREQSASRAALQPLEWDEQHGLHKLSPLLEWTHQDVWQYIAAQALPYNTLHDRQYPSIGCAPCTRAVEPGEPSRAGRWWWEQSGPRECGLHLRTAPHAVSP